MTESKQHRVLSICPNGNDTFKLNLNGTEMKITDKQEPTAFLHELISILNSKEGKDEITIDKAKFRVKIRNINNEERKKPFDFVIGDNIVATADFRSEKKIKLTISENVKVSLVNKEDCLKIECKGIVSPTDNMREVEIGNTTRTNVKIKLYLNYKGFIGDPEPLEPILILEDDGLDFQS